MASPTLQLGDGRQPSPEDQKPDQRPETSAATPATGKPEDRLAAFFKTQDKTAIAKFESGLKTCWKQHIEDWSVQRREVIRSITRAIEYKKGNQHIGWDPLTCAYVGYNDIMRSQGTNAGTEQGHTDYTPQKNVNVIGWACRVWSSMFGTVPGVEWWPGDSDSDLDARAAVARDRAYGKISSDNEDRNFLEQCKEFLFLTGHYFRHIRWSMDPGITGTHYEDITSMQERQVSPDRFECPQCGGQAPVDLSQNLQENVPCPQCGKPLGQENFYPGARIKMPVITGQREVPNGQVRWDVVHGLSMEVMPQANTNGGGVIANTPLGDYQAEITKGAFRRLYPDNWDLAKNSGSDSGITDGEIARQARMRVASPGGSRSGGSSFGTNTLQKMNSLHRVWYTQDAIAAIDKKEDADELAQYVGEGCVGVWFQDKLIDIQPAVFRKQWTWCGAEKGVGAYPTAPVKLGLDFQDRINDRTDSVDDAHDRIGCPPILFNETIIGEGMNGVFLPPATMIGVAVNGDVGRSMKDVFFQPEFHLDATAPQWIEQLFKYFQLLLGLTPMTFGGSDKDIKTKGGQEQALDTAKGTLLPYWNALRAEWTRAATLSVDCFAENATDDEYKVTKSDSSSDFSNEPIRLADLDGKADARPLADQDYPIDFEAQRALYKELIQMASGREPNPLVMEVLDTPENRRCAMRYLAPYDFELPEQIFIDKIKADITALIAPGAQPIPSNVPGPDGMPVMKPSVEPDKEFFSGKWDLVISQVIRYGIKNWQELPLGSPADVQIRGYLKLAVMSMQMEKIAGQAGPALLDAGTPGWGGKLGQAPPGKGGPSAPVPGGGAM